MTTRRVTSRIASFVLAAAIAGPAAGDAGRALSPDSQYRWVHMQGNLAAQQRLLELSGLEAADTLIHNVNLVDAGSGTVREGVSVFVSHGKIVWLGRSGETPGIDADTRIDGRNRFLAPGLTDMHVHTQDDGDYLLHLAFGVTSIREMNGWPWRLERRRMVEAGRLLAPNMYITSRILNSNDFGGYALAVDSVAAARAAVRSAQHDGYDAIKVHNGLTKEVFMAIAAEARSVGLDVVGHIPVRVGVREAVEAGMHTAEHFKGYLDDSTLQISGDDWLTPTIGADIFLTPTFYTFREHLRGTDAEAIIDSDGGFVLPHRRLSWRRYADAEADSLTKLRQSIRPKSEQIFEKLLPHDIQWLAGTDSGGYELMVPGAALIEELEIMQELGLSPAEALRSATSRAAAAMHWSDRTGAVRPGLSADLVLLDANPLETVSNLRTLQGVMVRGIWIARPADLVVNGEGIDPEPAVLSRRRLQQAVEIAERHSAAGYAQSTLSLGIWSMLARDIGADDLAARLEALGSP